MSCLTVNITTDYDQYLLLEPEWSRLLGASGANFVFMTHQWYRCWWEAFGQDDQMCILCVRDDGGLVGAGALHVTRSSFRRFPVRRLLFMANACSAEADFTLARPQEPILRAILQYLSRRQDFWDMLDLQRLRSDSATWRGLPEAAGQAGLSHTTRQDKQTPYIKISGDWDSFVAQRSGNFRKALRRRTNRLRKWPEAIRVVRLSRPDDVVAALPRIFEVSSRSWKANRKSAITDRPGYALFYERLSTVLAAKGWVDLWILYCGDRAIAFEYHLNYRGVTSPIRADFDEAYVSLSPGAHLESAILQSLFNDPSRAVQEYNTCADGYAYERRLTSDVRSHHRAWLFRRGGYGKLLHALGLLRRPWKPQDSQSVRNG